jgi:hypothetical protein
MCSGRRKLRANNREAIGTGEVVDHFVYYCPSGVVLAGVLASECRGVGKFSSLDSARCRARHQAHLCFRQRRCSDGHHQRHPFENGGKGRNISVSVFPSDSLDETQFTLEAKPDVKFVRGPFYPIGVQGKQTLVLSFIFIQYTNNPNFKSAKIDPQEHKLTVLTRTGASKTYDQQQSFIVNLDQGALDTLRQGTMVQVNSDLDKPRDLVK